MKYFLLILFIAFSTQLFSQDTLWERKDFKLPLFDKKMVIAHCMTHIIGYQGHKMEDGCNPAYYPITDNPSASIGGLTQVNVMHSFMSDSSLEAAVAFEMKAAKRCGIDGFQFYYTLNNKWWDKIIEAYFKVADENNIDFKFTFCFSHPQNGKVENIKLIEYASRVNAIMEHVGRGNRHWLRTPDGRLIVYMWYGEQIADIPYDNMEGHPQEYYYARAYAKLANAVGERFACMYSINEKVSTSQLHKILDYFPTVWLWTGAYMYDGFDERVAQVCTKRGRQFTQSAFSDFYTSKVLKPGTWNMVGSAVEAASIGCSGLERKYMIMGLSETFRNQLEFAVKKNVAAINVLTWNDYPEGHHLAPEVNHNFGFSVLLKYYKSIWENTPSPYADRDVAIAFFKKYKSTISPSPYNISIVSLGKTTKLNIEDSIEVVTILPSAAQLQVNGEVVNIPAGIKSTRFTYRTGAVKVAVMRDNKVSKSFTTPEWITDKPLRTDRITYSFDTEFMNFYKDFFGNRPPIYSTQYNLDFKKGKE